MNFRHILFVEDDEAQLDLFQTAVNDWNKNHEGEEKAFKCESAKTVDEAESLLARCRYDAAMFDLRIGNGKNLGKVESKGNELARFTLINLGIPVGIMTADDSKLDDDVRTAGVVQVFDKGGGSINGRNPYEQAVDWLHDHWEMMKALDAAKINIGQASADIFVKRLWPRWKALFSNIKTEELEQIFTRQYVTHMAEWLGLDDPDNVSWHPFENYISPSFLENRSHTGDIFYLDGHYWVVLSPQCDMATQKIENVILAKCEVGIPKWKDSLDAFKAATSNTQKKDPTTFLKGLVNQALPPSKHFLPALPDLSDPLMVDFSDLHIRSLTELNNKLGSRIAAISPPFLPNLVQRFGAYISRMGQPNIDIERF